MGYITMRYQVLRTSLFEEEMECHLVYEYARQSVNHLIF